MLGKGVVEVFGVSFVGVLDAEIIDYEAERDAVRFMPEESGCSCCRMVACGFQAWEEKI